MAKFLYWSDLHQEFAPFSLPVVGEKIDAVLLGGDTTSGSNLMDFLRQVHDTYQVPVLFVLGNHEFYNQTFEAYRRAIYKDVLDARDEGLDIEWLDGTARVVNGTRVIGATLWTDMDLHRSVEIAKLTMPKAIKDYQRISVEDPTFSIGKRLLQVQDTIEWHKRDKQRLFSIAAAPFEGPTLSLTHHAPSNMCFDPAYKSHASNPAFGSELFDDIARSSIDWWLFGHTHLPAECNLERDDGQICRLRSNARGYPWESKSPMSRFDPVRVIDTDAN